MKHFSPTSDCPTARPDELCFVLHPMKSTPVGLVAKLGYLDNLATDIGETIDQQAAAQGFPCGGIYVIDVIAAALRHSDPTSFETILPLIYWALFTVGDFADATDRLLKFEPEQCIVHVSLDAAGTPRVRVEVPDPATAPTADRAARAHQTLH